MPVINAETERSQPPEVLELSLAVLSFGNLTCISMLKNLFLVEALKLIDIINNNLSEVDSALN